MLSFHLQKKKWNTNILLLKINNRLPAESPDKIIFLYFISKYNIKNKLLKKNHI